MFEINFLSFSKNDEGFWLTVCGIDNFGDFDRSLFLLGKREDTWFLELFFVRITPKENGFGYE